MSGTQRGWKVLDGTDEQAATAVPDAVTKVSSQMLLLALRALSERFVTAGFVAFNTLFTAGLIWSAWLLWSQALSNNPTTPQLVGIGLYGVLVIAIEIIRRKRP